MNRVFSFPEISERAAAFDERLAEAKSKIKLDFPWYPYNTLGGFYELSNLLTAEWPNLFELIGSGPVMDLCCADGDLSFFLETLGYRVTAVDLARTNYNRMAGVHAMKEALRSEVEIRELDLDSQFTLHENYGLVVFMGGLYHLKNPFHVLDTLARHACYLILSTRIARYTPDRQVDLGQIPVAYLLDENEANDDVTNYWIFSELGLRRLFQRTKWDVCSFLVLGAETHSDPASNDADARAFCLLRSRFVPRGIELLSGWHRMEPSGWRWTMRRFSLGIPAPQTASEERLRLRLAVPEILLQDVGAIRLIASAQGVALPGAIYDAAGEYDYEIALPERVPGELLTIEFELDKALVPGSYGDDRELGIIVIEAEVRCPPREPLPGRSPS